MLCGFSVDLYFWLGTRVPWTWWVMLGALVTFTVGWLTSLFCGILLSPNAQRTPRRSEGLSISSSSLSALRFRGRSVFAKSALASPVDEISSAPVCCRIFFARLVHFGIVAVHRQQNATLFHSPFVALRFVLGDSHAD